MSNKPVSERAWMQTRAALWEAIRGLKTFTPRELRYETRCSTSQVSEYLKGLAAAGIVERMGDGLYALINDCGIEPPRVRRDGSRVTQGLGREQMWRTMKMLREFTPLDLSVNASTEAAQVKLSTAKDYCHFLQQAGYLAAIRKGKGTGRGGQQTLYRFIPARNTGPHPPMVQRVKQVYDPNLCEVVWDSEEGRHE
jgi:hypothetical protein